MGWFFVVAMVTATATAMATATVQDKEGLGKWGEKVGMVFFYQLLLFLIYMIVIAKWAGEEGRKEENAV